MWARADLKRRWRSWAVLGVLAGVSVGIACAGVAGARRTDRAVPTYAHAVHVPDAAVLANDPEYVKTRAAVDRLPQVEVAYPFMVPFALQVASPRGFETGLLPVSARSMRVMAGVLVDGRLPDAARPDEMTVNQAASRQFDLHVGSTVVLVQEKSPQAPAIEQRLRVVGVTHSPDEQVDSMPSSAFYAKY